MKTPLIKHSIALFLSLFLCAAASAEIAVIVHKSKSDSLSEDQISKIFLGKQSVFPDGSEAVPINLAEGNASRESFDSTVLGKNARQMKAYWSKLVFTGKGTPPKEVSSDAQMLELIEANPNLVGYVDASNVTGNVKVVHKF